MVPASRAIVLGSVGGAVRVGGAVHLVHPEIAALSGGAHVLGRAAGVFDRVTRTLPATVTGR